VASVLDRVHAGATYLWATDPTWPWRVDIHALDLGSPANDIAGHLGGDFHDWLHTERGALDLTWAADHGLYAAGVPGGPDVAEDYAQLTTVWRRLILDTRATYTGPGYRLVDDPPLLSEPRCAVPVAVRGVYPTELPYQGVWICGWRISNGPCGYHWAGQDPATVPMADMRLPAGRHWWLGEYQPWPCRRCGTERYPDERHDCQPTPTGAVAPTAPGGTA